MYAVSSEAARYTTAMWQSHIGRMVALSWESDAQRRGFRDGFNGEEKPHHHAVRGSFDMGRQTSVLLGYAPISEPST
jgi:hypothetical protein